MEEKNLGEAVSTGVSKEVQKCVKIAYLKEVCLLGHAEQVSKLLKHVEIDLNQRDEQGHTLLSIACTRGVVEQMA